MSDEPRSPEQEVARLFELAGYEVSQAVGAEPGTVDWFATPREGFVRPRTYWRVWKTCPEELERALEELERARVERRADRALAVVMKGEPPPEHSAYTSKTASASTLRVFALGLANIIDQNQQYVATYAHEKRDQLFLPRRGSIDSTEIPDVISHIIEWLESNQRTDLFVAAPPFSGCSTTIAEARYQAARRFLSNMNAHPALTAFQNDPITLEVLSRGWATPALILDHDFFFGDTSDQPTLDYQLLRPTLGPRILAAARSQHFKHSHWGNETIIQLRPPTSSDTAHWYRKQINSEPTHKRLLEARDLSSEFKLITDAIPNLSPIAHTLSSESAPDPKAPVQEWITRVAIEYMEHVHSGPGDTETAQTKAIDEIYEALSDAALVQFGLGNPLSLRLLSQLDRGRHIAAQLSTWTNPPIVIGQNLKTVRGATVHPPLVLHYFLARKIARAVRAGNLDILTRYQFPREYVLLFLALLAPDVAAQVTEERTDQLRAQIETEVERRLQLTLAHMLKRSAGAVRSHINSIHRHVERTSPGAMSREFTRVEEEVAFQCALAEQTRLWHEVPESAIEGLSLREHVDPLVADLRETYPHVACDIDVDVPHRVRASRDVLREILHCLLENAFQAATLAKDMVDQRVRVEAHLEGETVRLDILDNGPGVAPDDRERIFDLYVTTKKGGDGKPLGTGMGLPIARRYAEHVGGQVGLDPEREGTCFYVRFVAWRDLG